MRTNIIIMQNIESWKDFLTIYTFTYAQHPPERRESGLPESGSLSPVYRLSRKYQVEDRHTP